MLACSSAAVDMLSLADGEGGSLDVRHQGVVGGQFRAANVRARQILAAELNRAHQSELFRDRRPLNAARADACHDLLHQVADQHEATTADRFDVRAAGEDEERHLIDLRRRVEPSQELWDVRASEKELACEAFLAAFP